MNTNHITTALFFAGILTLGGCSEPAAPVSDPAEFTPELAVSAAPIPVSLCNTHITQPGNYALVRDLVNCIEPVITIQGQPGMPAILQLNGHKIVWTRSPDEFGGTPAVSIGSYAAVIGPGTIERYNYNVGMGGVQMVLRGVLVKNPFSFGVSASGSDIRLQGNTFRGGPEAAVDITAASNVLVLDNLFARGPTSLAEPALKLQDLSGIEVRDNRFHEVETGVEILGGGSHLIVRNSFRGSEKGIYMERSSGNGILRNSLVRTFQGIVVFGGGNNEVVDNSVTDGGLGISMEGGTTGNRIANNTALNNSTDLGDEAGCENLNTWVNNIFNTSFPPDCLH